jgi:CRP/FNR family transcriptional regulator, cyclic AMP receptor protein
VAKTQQTSKDSAEKGIKQCPVGTVLFREGEPGDRMYVIKSGTIRISKLVFDAEVALEDLGAGEFCGELALLGAGNARLVTATVIADAAVIPLDAPQFETMVRTNADIAMRMLKKMTQRLTESQHRISNLILRSTRGRVLHQLRHEVMTRSTTPGQLSPAPLPDNLADALALELGEIKQLLNQLVKDELITLDRNGYFQIQDLAAFDRYLRYLELQDRFSYTPSAS